MIIAHNEFDILEKLVQLLDDPRNDLYIHIDKKVRHFPFDHYRNIVKLSRLTFVHRQDVRWGDYSMIQCELTLLKAALKGNYQYYHLLSGVDLPLKSNDAIHSFFCQNAGKEFVHFCTDEEALRVRYRVEQYHFMRLRSDPNRFTRPFSIRMMNYLLYFQEKTRYTRTWDDNSPLAFGAQWFSITHELASYIIDHENWISKHFRFTSCADELFLQTLIANSQFKDRLYIPEHIGDYTGCMRYIDWKRGHPYVFRSSDFQDLIDSHYLFARKFSTKIDPQIIEQIFHHLKKS